MVSWINIVQSYESELAKIQKNNKSMEWYVYSVYLPLDSAKDQKNISSRKLTSRFTLIVCIAWALLLVFEFVNVVVFESCSSVLWFQNVFIIIGMFVVGVLGTVISRFILDKPSDVSKMKKSISEKQESSIMINITQEEIMKNWQGDINQPLVSVHCITYNHENYIAQALDGFLMQKTNFPFEVIVHDDASPDKTADIVREYEKKYPAIIKAIYQTENQYSKRDGTIERIMNEACKGKYIALCEGDDYWIDENKLQMQVDFLEGNPEYTMCFSNCKVECDGVIEEQITPGICVNSTVATKDLILNGGMFIPTPSIVYNKSILVNYPSYCKECWVGDYPLQIYSSLVGKVFCFESPFVVYRKLSQGSWTAKTSKQSFNQKKSGIESELRMLNGLNCMSSYQYNLHFTKRKIIFLGKNCIKEMGLVFEGPWYNFFVVAGCLFSVFLQKFKKRI